MLVTAILNFIFFGLIVLFVMAYDHILNFSQINNESGTSEKLMGLFCG